MLLEKFKKIEQKTEPAEQVKPASVKQKLSRPPFEIYRIIKEPHITEKATLLTEQNKYVFKIAPQANKTEVKKAVEAFYGVKVEKVHLIHLPAKRRRLGRREGWRKGLKKGFKKAVVTLAKGEKIELLPR